MLSIKKGAAKNCLEGFNWVTGHKFETFDIKKFFMIRLNAAFETQNHAMIVVNIQVFE